ncbi:MAG: hypothetical protein K9L78_03760 [Victivallales bacterium]|nr:hypothetical protein [Victivallales bacterium]MCF7889216.1 hypothetical protein [Victivallales bacterium]
MKKKIHKIKFFSARDKGIATVLTLGILALLAALAVSFVSESILLDKISKNSLDLERSRLMAQSMVQRTIAVANKYNETTSSSLIDFHSTLISGDTAVTDELNEAITTNFNNIRYYQWNATDPDSPCWQYIRTIRNSNNDSQIIGRVAYVTVNNIGKLDPSVIVDSGASGNAVTEDTSLYTSYGNIGRPGKYVNEIFMRNLDSDSSYFTNAQLKTMSADNATPPGELPSNSRWFDLSEMIGAVNSNATEDTRTRFNNWFTTDAPKDPEAFWIDVDNDDTIDSQYELFHRFNLRRNDWGLLSVSDITGADAVLHTSSYTNAAVKCIPWLKNWKSSGGMGSATNCKNQIIANLIDYCDTDTEPTTDYPGTSPPTYLGHENVPYINEIKLEIEGYIEEDASFRYRAHIDIVSASLELVNMYGDTIAADAEIDFGFESDVYVDDGLGDYYTYNRTSDAIDPIEINFGSVSSESYTVETGTVSYVSNWTDAYDSSRDRSFTDFIITEILVKLKDSNGNIINCSSIVEGQTGSEDFSFDGSTGTVYFHGQVADPRQNLLEDDWAGYDFTTVDPVDTLDTNNASYNPDQGAGYDTESENADPWDISTAYIRNAPMESPWELGFIHRGKKWQTINLKAYDDADTQGAKSGAGGDAYSNGDANILDQVKMTSATETYGKVNINSPYPETDADSVPQCEIYKALFTDVYFGTNPEDPGEKTGATQITAAHAEILAEDIVTKSNSDSGIFKTRGQLLRDTNGIPDLYSVTGMNSDAKKEELIGKVINLTTGGTSNNITLIVAAQTIKDVGGNSDAVGDSDPGVSVTFNGTTKTCRYNEYIPGYDPILAEQKVLVILTRDPVTFEWKIKKLRYIN